MTAWWGVRDRESTFHHMPLRNKTLGRLPDVMATRLKGGERKVDILGIPGFREKAKADIVAISVIYFTLVLIPDIS